MMNVDNMDWYKEKVAKDIPGRALSFYHKPNGMTQRELAGKFSTTNQFISSLENDREPISRMITKSFRKSSKFLLQGSSSR